MAHNIQVRELIRSVAEWREGSEQTGSMPRHDYVMSRHVGHQRAPVKNPKAACRGMLILCRGMSLGACRSMTKSCRGMAITRFLESSFFLYLVLNRLSINSQLL